MDKYIELRKIFAGILKSLGLSEEEVQSLSTFVRTPVEMEKMVNLIEENPNITYQELMQASFDIIDYEIK